MKNFTQFRTSLMGRIASGLLTKASLTASADKNFKKIHLAIIACVFLTSMSYAQVVAVPAGCVVVIPGTGGTVGPYPTGFVGNGGIVSMPDPSGGGQFNFSVAGTATTASWSLRGDISNTNVTPNSSPVQPAAGSSANIFTCNKYVRTSETSTSWARSKGQVRLSFSQSGCSGQTLTFDIFKSFTASPLTNVPEIVGPSCLKPNTTYTYSVDQIVSDNINDAIGVDSYYWSGIPAAYLPGSSTDFYTSADGSSITFKTGASVTAFDLQCCYGRVNPTANNVDGGVSTYTTLFVPGSHSTCVTKQLKVAPSQPGFTATTFLNTLATMNATVSPSACLATGQNTFTLTYPNPASGQIYTWTAPNSGWTFTTNTTATTTLTGNTNGNNNPATITLTITGNTCDPVVFNYQINRNLAAPLQVVATGVNGTCINATSTGVNTYTISPNPFGIPLTWSTVPASVAGVTLVNANSNTVTVNTAGAALGTSFTLQVIASGSTTPCNTAISTTIYVRPAPPTITGPTPACIPRGTTTTTAISCNAVTGATGYSWNLTGAPGWSIFANGNTVNPTFTPNGTGTGPVTISVTALGVSGAGCNSNPSASFIVNYSPVAPAVSAISCWNTSVPTVGSLVMPTKTLTITNLQNFGTYSVDPNPALFSSASVNSGTGVITLINPVFLNTGSYSIVVRHSNGPCTAATTTLTVTVTAVTVTTPPTAVSFNGPNGIVDNYTYVVGTTPAGVTFASWFVNNAPVVANGTTVSTVLNQLSLAGTTPPTNVGIYVNDNGCFKRVYSPSVGTKSASRQSNPNNGTPIKEIIISPNPNDGNFVITALDFKETATAILYDMNGKVITTAVLNKGENKIQKGGLAKGTYTVSLLVDGKTEARKIIIK